MTIFLILAAVFGTSALLVGSLGAHLWQEILADPEAAGRFHRAENYLFYHALGLAVVAQLVERFPAQKFQSVGWCLTVGVVIFSGSLLVYSLTGFKPIIKATPFGGSLLILGWILLGIRSSQMWYRTRHR
jgi:uncharacterized membrane protein YgdD (TMEM256/DUF423 family)